ncbi:MAG: serine/threonine-protein kinase [Cyanobacteria bacterium P01_A01_bin.83]
MKSEPRNLLSSGKILRSHYQIIDVISNNTGFGVTYLAEDLDLPHNHKCVVKQLNRQKIEPTFLEKATELFERESKCLYKLGNHEQIPALFACFEENNEFYLVQEYIDGEDLDSEIIANQPWSEAKTIKFLREILEILAFVHQHKSIHRDIKPSNIMRRKHDQKLVLIDFGAVKEINTINTMIDSFKNSFPTIIVSPPFSAPEQYKGQPVFASDIYSVGMIGIVGLTGLVYDDQWQNSPNLKISDRLLKILKIMTHHDCQQRYQDANEALDAINQTIMVQPASRTFWSKTQNWWEKGTFE